MDSAPASTSRLEKHRVAGAHVARQYEAAVKEIHLKIKHRGKYTTWSARKSPNRHGA